MKEVAELLLKTNAITLRTNPPYKWVSGILAPIYTDNRILLSYPQERKKIIDFFVEAIEENKLHFDVVAGVSTAGIPWGAWLAEKLDKPMIYVRSSAKDHGKENLIEGKLEKGSRTIVIEDLISTGSSSLAAVEAIRNAGCEVICCLAIFTYELEKSKVNFEQANCNLVTLTNFTALIETSIEMGYLNAVERQKVMEWKKNPEEWGR